MGPVAPCPLMLGYEEGLWSFPCDAWKICPSIYVLCPFLQWRSQDKEGCRHALLGTKQGVGVAAATSLPRRCGPRGGLSW